MDFLANTVNNFPILRGEMFISLANASLSKSFSRKSSRFSISYWMRSNSRRSSVRLSFSGCTSGTVIDSAPEFVSVSVFSSTGKREDSCFTCFCKAITSSSLRKNAFLKSVISLRLAVSVSFFKDISRFFRAMATVKHPLMTSNTPTKPATVHAKRLSCCSSFIRASFSSLS